MPTEASAQARPTRAAALLLAAAAAIRELAGGIPLGPAAGAIWGIRLAESTIALVVAALSSLRRSTAQLRGLTFVRTLVMHVVSIAVAILMPLRTGAASLI